MAALDFLLNVPMAKEDSIRETGLRNLRRSELLYSDDNNPERIDGFEGSADFAASLRFATIQVDR